MGAKLFILLLINPLSSEVRTRRRCPSPALLSITVISHHHQLPSYVMYNLLGVNSWPHSEAQSKSRGPRTMIPFLLHFFLLFFSADAGDGNPLPVRREIHGGGRIIDISHRYVPEMPSWAAFQDGLGQFLWLKQSMKNGSEGNLSEMKMPTHTGTHVDAPGHMIDRYFDAGFDVDTLDLDVLNGPALLIDVPRDKNITAEVMESLKIPKGVRRVIFRTSNTERQLMFKKEYDTSYTAFTTDGAKWLVENTDIKLVGIDFLSVATHEHLLPAHLEFLDSREIILVEGLKLDNIQPGLYSVHCLPLRLLGAEGSPIRCILIK